MCQSELVLLCANQNWFFTFYFKSITENKMISNSLKFQLSNLIKNEFLNPPSSFGIKLILS